MPRTHDIDGETTDTVGVYLYESERYAVADDLEASVERNRNIGEEFATIEDYSVEESDDTERVLVVSGTVQTRA